MSELSSSVESGAQSEAPTRRRSAAGYLRAVWGILRKDLAAERRSRELLGSMVVFALLVIIIFNYSLRLDLRTRETVTAGVLWVTLVFAGTLGLNRSMSVEREGAAIDGLLLSPVDRSAIYFGKALGNLVFILIVAAIVVPVFSLLYSVNLFNPLLLLIIVLGSIGYSAVGTLLASMTAQARTRDILLPILLFPIILPLLITAVSASSGILQDFSTAEVRPWINLLVVYDVIFIAAAFMVFDFIVEE